jgi:DNA-binding XRE family transcriptional regulator
MLFTNPRSANACANSKAPNRAIAKNACVNAVTPLEFRATRKALGLTQTELAAALDLSRDAIARYEGGRLAIPRVVELAVAAKLAADRRDWSLIPA